MIVFGVRSWKIRKIMRRAETWAWQLQGLGSGSKVWLYYESNCTMLISVEALFFCVEAPGPPSLCSLCALSLCAVCGVWSREKKIPTTPRPWTLSALFTTTLDPFHPTSQDFVPTCFAPARKIPPRGSRGSTLVGFTENMVLRPSVFYGLKKNMFYGIF